MNSSQKTDRRKTTGLQSAKPFPDFPLFVHKSGRWAKKITHNGKSRFVYFGRVADGWEPALRLFEAQKIDLYSGRTPDTMAGGVSLLGICNEFIHAKKRRADLGKLTWRSFHEYKATCAMLLEQVGRAVAVEKLKPEDFDEFDAMLASRYGAVSQTNHLQRVHSLFKFALKERLIDRPVHHGTRLARPARRELRLERAAKVDRVFEAREIRRLLRYRIGHKLADPIQLRAMILLGVNAGLGNDDCGRLRMEAVDLSGGWCNSARNKTGIPRRAKLWPETIAALKATITKRPTPKDPADAGLVFITKYGGRWSKEATEAQMSADNPVAKMFSKMMKGAGVAGQGRGFYCCRHTFFTVASNGGDQVAASFVMGHADESMAAQYRHSIDDVRLEAVAHTVRRWIFRRTSSGLWKPLQHLA